MASEFQRAIQEAERENIQRDALARARAEEERREAAEAQIRFEVDRGRRIAAAQQEEEQNAIAMANRNALTQAAQRLQLLPPLHPYRFGDPEWEAYIAIVQAEARRHAGAPPLAPPPAPPSALGAAGAQSNTILGILKHPRWKRSPTFPYSKNTRVGEILVWVADNTNKSPNSLRFADDKSTVYIPSFHYMDIDPTRIWRIEEAVPHFTSKDIIDVPCGDIRRMLIQSNFDPEKLAKTSMKNLGYLSGIESFPPEATFKDVCSIVRDIHIINQLHPSAAATTTTTTTTPSTRRSDDLFIMGDDENTGGSGTVKEMLTDDDLLHAPCIDWERKHQNLESLRYLAKKYGFRLDKFSEGKERTKESKEEKKAREYTFRAACEIIDSLRKRQIVAANIARAREGYGLGSSRGGRGGGDSDNDNYRGTTVVPIMHEEFYSPIPGADNFADKEKPWKVFKKQLFLKQDFL